MATKKTIIELTLVGGEKIKVDFDQIGEKGQRALKRILDSSKPVPASLRAVEAVAGELHGKVGTLAGSLGTLGTGLAALGPAGLAAAGVAGAAGGLFIVAKKAIDTASALQDTSDRIGVNVEALQELQFAASQSGASQEALAAGLGTFTKRVGEAKNGTGELVSALKDHDKQLLEGIRNTGSMEGALELAFQALGKEEDAAKRAALGNALFGRSWRELAPIMKDGVAGLEDLRQKARDLGLVLDAETVAAAETAGDKLDALAQIVGVHLTRAALTLTPLIDALAQKTIEWATDLTILAAELGLVTLNAEALGRAAKNLPKDFGPSMAEVAAKKDVLKEIVDQQLAAMGIQREAAKAGDDAGKQEIATLEELAEQKKRDAEAERDRKKAAADSARERESALRDLAKLEEEAATAALEGIAKVEAERDQEVERRRRELERGAINEEEFARKRVALEQKAQADITQIQEDEQKKRDDARSKLEDLVRDSEQEVTEAVADESDKRRIEFENETEDRLAQFREQALAAGHSEAEITAILEAERGRRKTIWEEQRKDAEKEFVKLSETLSSIVGEIATGILHGTRDGSIGDIMKDAGIALGLKLVEGTIEQKLSATGIDKLLSTNLFELGASLPGLLVDGFMGQGGLGGLVNAVLGQKGGLDSTIVSTVTGQGGGGGGGGGLLGNAASLVSSGTLLASATPAITSLAGNASVAAAADAGLIHLAADAGGNIVIGLGPGASAVALEGGVAGGTTAGGSAGAGAAGGSAAGTLGATGIGAIVAAAVLGGIQTYTQVQAAMHGDIKGGATRNALDPLGILGMAGVDISNVLGITHVPTEGTQFRTGIGQTVRDLFPDMELLFKQFDEAEERFPELFESALPPIRAVATAIAEMADTPLKTADETAQLVNVLINSMAAEGKSGAEAVGLGTEALKKLGITAEDAGRLALTAMEEGRISAEEFEQVVLGLAEIAGIPFDVMREAIGETIGSVDELIRHLEMLGAHEGSRSLGGGGVSATGSGPEDQFPDYVGGAGDVPPGSTIIQTPGGVTIDTPGDSGVPDFFIPEPGNPAIPGFAAGGVVPGAVGAETIIRAHGGETVLPTHDPAAMRRWSGGVDSPELAATMEQIVGLLTVLLREASATRVNTGTARTIPVQLPEQVAPLLHRLEREQRLVRRSQATATGEGILGLRPRP